MPIYEYLCDECKTPYEKLVLSKSEQITCPKCGSARKTQQLSVFAAHGGGNGTGASSRDAASSTPACMGNPSACGCSHKN
jgi:putative FmdB family regulatory protein